MDLIEQLKTYVQGNLVFNQPQLELAPETPLRDVLDSTSYMDLVVWLENTFGIQVDLEDLVPDNFGSLRRLASYVERRRAA